MKKIDNLDRVLLFALALFSVMFFSSLKGQDLKTIETDIFNRKDKEVKYGVLGIICLTKLSIYDIPMDTNFGLPFTFVIAPIFVSFGRPHH